MNIWDTNMSSRENRQEVNDIIKQYNSDRDLYYLAGLVMASKYESSHDEISSLFMLVDGKSLKRLCKVLGGKILRIPTYSELIASFKLISFMNEYSKGKTISESLEIAGFEPDELHVVVNSYQKLVKEMKNSGHKPK